MQLNLKKFDLKKIKIFINIFVPEGSNNNLINLVVFNKDAIIKYIYENINILVSRLNVSHIYEFIIEFTPINNDNGKSAIDNNCRIVLASNKFEMPIKDGHHPHLLLVETKKGVEVEYNFDRRYFINNIDKFKEILLGISLDTVMFYYNNFATIFNTDSTVQTYLSKKVNYLQQFNNYKIDYKYDCFYIYYKNNQIFDWNAFLNAWEEFVKFLFPCLSPFTAEDKRTICSFILNNHPQCKQLSEKRILKELNISNNGFPLIFVRIIKKPSRNRVKSNLLKILGKTEFHIGHVKFVDYVKLTKLIAFEHYLSIYIIY